MLRTIFHVARLSADQRGIQKKDEHRFCIFDIGQLQRGELTCQLLGMYGQLNCSLVLNLNRNRT